VSTAPTKRQLPGARQPGKGRRRKPQARQPAPKGTMKELNEMSVIPRAAARHNLGVGQQ
jgi:hypothetical protein